MRAPVPFRGRQHRFLGSALAFLVVASAGPVLAQTPAAGGGTASPRVLAPIAVPPGVGEPLSDFIDICPVGIQDVAAGAKQATARGWTSVEGGSALETAAMAAFGVVNLARKIGGDDAILTIMRAEFPHVTTFNCTITLYKGEIAIDTTVLGRIDGILGGGLLTLLEPGVGRWSYLDESGTPVTISTNSLGGRGAFLSMGRGVPSGPPAKPDPAG